MLESQSWALCWGVIVADRSYLFVGFFGSSLAIAAWPRTGLPLPLLTWSLLFLGTVTSNMSLLVAAEADDFPYVVLRSLWICYRLTPSVSSWHKVFCFCQPGVCSARGCIHWFIFGRSKWCPSSLLIVAGGFELLQSLLEPLLLSF